MNIYVASDIWTKSQKQNEIFDAKQYSTTLLMLC